MTRYLKGLREGRVQRTLAGLTAAGAIPLGLEIYFNHLKGSFGNKWMWTPVVLSPVLAAAGAAGVKSERAARTVLPAAGALYAFDAAFGTFMHVRGIARRPGGFSEPVYNLMMGPPMMAPGSLALVGGLGVAAGFARRER